MKCVHEQISATQGTPGPYFFPNAINIKGENIKAKCFKL